MKRLILTGLLSLLLLQVFAQMDQPAPTVFIYVNGNPHPMTAITMPSPRNPAR